MNNNVTYTLDNVPFNKFHGKLAAYTLGGSFIDGYILGIIEFALVLLIPALDMNSTWQGLIGSSPLIGIFIGALFLGRLADAIGRKKLYTLDFLVIIIASLLQSFVGSPATLFIIRVLSASPSARNTPSGLHCRLNSCRSNTARRCCPS